MPQPLFTPGKDLVPTVQEAGCAPGPVWTGAENLAPIGIRSPDRQARSHELPGPIRCRVGKYSYNLKEIMWKNMDWIQMVPDRDLWCCAANNVKKFRVIQRIGDYLKKVT